MGDGARCLAAAECSGVTVPVMGHDERPHMKDEACRILGRGATRDLLPQGFPHRSGADQTFLWDNFLLESALVP